MNTIKSTAALIGNFMHAHVHRLSAGGSAVWCRSWSAELHAFRPAFTRAQHAEAAARLIEDAMSAVAARDRDVRLERASWYAIDGTMFDQSDAERTKRIFCGILKAIDPELLQVEVVRNSQGHKTFQEVSLATA